ncbi:MAG TPA: Ku protein [Gemmatimonadaceae bacterium]|nr:Ku protein [Gemmatimonadaceae bacterium]
MPDADDVVEQPSARPFWSGTITFGLVSVPVNFMAAYRADRVSLRMVSPEGRPLSRRYFTSRDEKPLEWDDIVRGYEIEKDEFVVVEDDELERLAPERTRDIDLRVFVKVDDIDPKFFERAYYLTPAGQSTKAYRLLAKVMEDTGRAGIATFVMRAKEYLVAIIAENGILRAETLRFVDEVRSVEDIGLPDPAKPKAADVKRIERAIDGLTEKALDRRELVDRSAKRLNELVAKKVKAGEDVVEYEPAAEEGDGGGKVLDLIEVLNRSLKGAAAAKHAAKSGKSGGRSASADGEDLGRLSKDELYARAKRLDIPGRSGMSKQELVAAIRRSA